MSWMNLFESHILQRGYNYYCENAVENLNATPDIVRADVIGTEEYNVEIFLDNGVSNMYCSCPYAESGRNCKHMAAVLFEWTEGGHSDEEIENDTDDNLFINAYTAESGKKREDAIQKLVEDADISVVRSYLTSILVENEKLLVRFNSIAGEQSTEEDVERYIDEVDDIAYRYLGRNQFINYYNAEGFIGELDDIIEKDVRRMIDNGKYMGAFELMNYIFKLIGDVDMDDSDGGTGMLADKIYELWLELLINVDEDDKQEMFQWFTSHMDGSIIDYLEEYIGQIIVEEFNEKEYVQQKKHFVEGMLKKFEELDSDWDRSYNTGKWATTYLDLLKLHKSDRTEIENFCKVYWKNSFVRSYYIDMCMKAKEYDLALRTLDESISLDKNYRGLISDYVRKKKEIYFLQGDKKAYVEILWELVLKYKAGDLEVYRELKKQYTDEEWDEKREEIFSKLPEYVDMKPLYKEEKLYDRLLDSVIKSPGLYELQHYIGILKKDYPEQILQKYKVEVNQMATYTGGREKYKQLVVLLRKMQKLKGGSEVVNEIVTEWKVQYKNRPAMMEELGKL